MADAPELDLDAGPAPPAGWGDPWLVGAVHEQWLSSEERLARGAWYTPRSVVRGLVRLATEDGVAPPFIVDLTCGGGAFLLAGLDRLVELGVAPAEAVTRVGGIDLDADAVQVSRWSVGLWLGDRLGPDAFSSEGFGGDVATDLRVGDALVDVPAAWARRQLIVGNPPFASPLKRGVVPAAAARYRSARSDRLGPYADIASIHLLRAVELAEDGSTVVLVQPQSILSGRDTEPLRAWLDEVAPLRALWAAREPVFDAGVRACAPVLSVGAERPAGVTLAFGPDVTARGLRGPQRWSGHGADALGAPDLPPMEGRLGELASATAGFRDEHYGLVSACREAAPGEVAGDGARSARLVTVGSLDPLTAAWGRAPFRFGGRDWTRPMVDRDGLPVKVAGWFDRQLRPKVLLATQTKLLEPVVDRVGDLVPATPLIAVHADARELDRVTAVLLAPPVVAWAWRRWFGSALTVDAVKLAARQVAELPLPADRAAWAEAAALVPRADGGEPTVAWDTAVEVAAIMTEAYKSSDQVLDWWLARLKPRPEGR